MIDLKQLVKSYEKSHPGEIAKWLSEPEDSINHDKLSVRAELVFKSLTFDLAVQFHLAAMEDEFHCTKAQLLINNAKLFDYLKPLDSDHLQLVMLFDEPEVKLVYVPQDGPYADVNNSAVQNVIKVDMAVEPYADASKHTA